MNELITSELVDLELAAQTRQTASRFLAERMVAAGRVTDLEGFLADVATRETKTHTGLEGGIGIPHCRSKHVTAPTLAFGRSEYGIDFGAHDGPADLVFLIAAPLGADDDHLKVLSALARRLMDQEFTTALRIGHDPAAVANLIRSEAGLQTAAAGPASPAPASHPCCPPCAAAGRPPRTRCCHAPRPTHPHGEHHARNPSRD